MIPSVLATWALLIQTILFAMKCDGSLEKSASWVLIWTPMWFVNLLLLILAVISFPDFVNGKGESIELKDTPVLVKTFNVVHMVSFPLFQVFLFIKLDNVIDWNWFAVFSPLLFCEGVLIVQCVRVNILPFLNPEYHFKFDALNSCIIHVHIAWFAVFVALKLNHQNEWNWGFVLLPVWVYLGINIILSCTYIGMCIPNVGIIALGLGSFCAIASWIWIPVWLAYRLEVLSSKPIVLSLLFVSEHTPPATVYIITEILHHFECRIPSEVISVLYKSRFYCSGL